MVDRVLLVGAETFHEYNRGESFPLDRVGTEGQSNRSKRAKARARFPDNGLTFIAFAERYGQGVGLCIEEEESKRDCAQAAHGAYLMRTNRTESDPVRLWKWTMRPTELEDAFRISKSDLGLRPVLRQREDRVQAHILICFLA